MLEMVIEPTSRKILPKTNRRLSLTQTDIKESIISIETNRGLEKFHVKAKQVADILDRKIIFEFAKN